MKEGYYVVLWTMHGKSHEKLAEFESDTWNFMGTDEIEIGIAEDKVTVLAGPFSLKDLKNSFKKRGVSNKKSGMIIEGARKGFQNSAPEMSVPDDFAPKGQG